MSANKQTNNMFYIRLATNKKIELIRQVIWQKVIMKYIIYVIMTVPDGRDKHVQHLQQMLRIPWLKQLRLLIHQQTTREKRVEI